MQRGATCHQCGGSTPLPDDLRVPTFRCSFCHTELQTAAFAGKDAVSADQLLGYVQAAVQNPQPGVSHADAPRFETRNAETRDLPCKHCQTKVAVPLDLRVHRFSCQGCGREQFVNEYISDRERFELDMERQVAGNQALSRLRADGVHCHACGGHNELGGKGEVQLTCRFCAATILLADHVDGGAVARARLAKGVFEMRDQMLAKQKERDRVVKIVSIVVFVAVALVFVAVGLLTSRR